MDFTSTDELSEGTTASPPTIGSACLASVRKGIPARERWHLSVPTALPGQRCKRSLDESTTYARMRNAPPWGYCDMKRLAALIPQDVVTAEDCMGEPCVVFNVACEGTDLEVCPIPRTRGSPTQHIACLGVPFGLLLIPQEVALCGSVSDLNLHPACPDDATHETHQPPSRADDDSIEPGEHPLGDSPHDRSTQGG
jgi:hypothetical protein